MTVLNPIIFLSRAILVALAATFLVVVVKAVAYLTGTTHIASDMLIGLFFAAGLAFCGARYGHQNPKRSTTPRILEVRIFLIQFALFLFALSALRIDFGTIDIMGTEMLLTSVVVPLLIALWYVYWSFKNVLVITEEQAQMIGSKKSEIALMSAGVLTAPFLLLIPGFALADVFGFDSMIIISVFVYAPIMSIALPAGYSIRKLVTHDFKPRDSKE